jgi:hypothetical protein
LYKFADGKNVKCFFQRRALSPLDEASSPVANDYIPQGRHADARKLFTRLLSRCNDVGLLAEELDFLTGRMLGNFP